MRIPFAALMFFAMSAVCVHAQEFNPSISGYTSMYIDPGSGEISAYAYTHVSDPEHLESIISLSASVETSLSSGGFVSGTDNCGLGCAQVMAYGQVSQLGTDYTASSDHSGEVGYYDGEEYNQSMGSMASGSVPPAPTIFLNYINAINPHAVQIQAGATANVLTAATLIYGPYNVITDASLTWSTLDQAAYPWGQNTLSITGFMYGLPVAGPSCVINYATNQSISNADNPPTYWAYTGGDSDHPGGAQFIPVTHIAGYVVNTVDYSGCGSSGNAPIPNSMTHLVTAESGSIDTSQCVQSIADCGMSGIGESSTYFNYSEGLPPTSDLTTPPQSSTFQTAALRPPDRWIPPNNSGSICNTTIFLITGTGIMPIQGVGCVAFDI